jgi:DNA-binding NarL/FixJ family response regulator
MSSEDVSSELREREKELACIHHLSRVLTALQPPEEVATVVASAVRHALTDPDSARVRVQYETTETQDQGSRVCGDRSVVSLEWCEPIISSAGRIGEICVGYAERVPTGKDSAGNGAAAENKTLQAIDHEREMLRTVAALLAEHGERRRVVEELRAAVAAENRKSVALEEVLTQVEELRRRNLADLRGTLEAEVLPLVARLEELSRPGPEKSLLEMLRDALSRLVQDSSTRNQAQRQTMRARLSPREYEIARMIAEGMPTKQIAETLNLARSTVERHRHGIRRKLGIRHERINLATFLRSDREE